MFAYKMTSATKPKQKAPKKAKKSSIWQRIKRYFLIAVLSFFGISISLVVIYRFVNPPLTYLMVQRFVNQCIDEKYDVRFKHSNRDFKEVSDNLKKALIASEDQLFLEHQGFDFEAMEKAYENNAKGKKKIKGGSTISQQVAKNVFLWPGRSYIRKGFEAYFTLLIELCWSKERIMEVYLNVIEWGNGIYGSEAAAQYYFKKPAKKLSASQAALLAAIVPNPRRWSASKPSPYILKRQRWILRNMNRLGVLEF